MRNYTWEEVYEVTLASLEALGYEMPELFVEELGYYIEAIYEKPQVEEPVIVKETKKSKWLFSKKDNAIDKKQRKETRVKPKKVDRKTELAKQMSAAKKNATVNSTTYARHYSRNMNIPSRSQILDLEEVVA